MFRFCARLSFPCAPHAVVDDGIFYEIHADYAQPRKLFETNTPQRCLLLTNFGSLNYEEA